MKVILDCDNTMGVRKSDVDDGLTFAYLYAHPDVEVQGITCTFANNNEHVVYYNTLQMMEDLEITDVPVLKGGRTPGAYDSEAVNFLVDTVNKNPGIRRHTQTQVGQCLPEQNLPVGRQRPLSSKL